jgi:DNA-binding NarL/FixJ family response regulator
VIFITNNQDKQHLPEVGYGFILKIEEFLMSITIFLADDHAMFRDGLRSYLEGQPDLKVIGEAADGRETVRQVAQRCPDVVLMDIAMPELNGVEATRQIQQLCPATQVIILSMHATSEHIFRALQAGARGYLLKEAAGLEVINAVRSVQAGQRYLSQKISDVVINDYVHQREASAEHDPLARLSPREREILQLVAEGKSGVEIAELLSLSHGTVDTYRSRLMRKLGLNDLPSVVKFAIQHGLISLD